MKSMVNPKPDASEALIDAFTKLLVCDGVAGISIKKVAAEAQVNHGLVHYHFGSKEGLVLAAYEHYRTEQKARVEGTDFSKRQAVKAMFLEEIQLSSRLMVEFTALSAHMPSLRDAIEEGLTKLVDTLRGRLGLPTNLDGDLLIAHFFGIAVHSRLRPSFDVEKALDALLHEQIPDRN